MCEEVRRRVANVSDTSHGEVVLEEALAEGDTISSL